jgi:hypothetical protein
MVVTLGFRTLKVSSLSPIRTTELTSSSNQMKINP